MNICQTLAEVLACSVQLKAENAQILENQTTIIELLGGSDNISLQEVCDKLDAQSLLLCEKIDALSDEICDESDPLCLTEEATATEMIVPGDATADYTVGSSMTVYGSMGQSLGTATVASATYDAASNTTTIAYNNFVATTGTTSTLSDIKAVKKRIIAKVETPVREGETQLGGDQ